LILNSLLYRSWNKSMNGSKANNAGWVRLAAFVVVHVAVITAGLVWAASRYRAHAALTRLPAIRSVPAHVGPLYDDARVISDDDLQNVLARLKPRLAGPRPKINHVDHALRFWGVEAAFNDPECLSGVEMREILTDHRRYRQVWTRPERPFLKLTGDGVEFRVRRGNASASHYDHTLASLAEVGTPLDFPLITPQGEATMRDMLEFSLSKFSLNQSEYEWSAVAFALCLEPTHGWVTSEGQHVTFDRIARRIMREPLTKGVCAGNHRLHALAILLRVDEQQPILSSQGRDEIIAHLRHVTDLLVKTQHEEGYWERNWDGAERPGRGKALPQVTDRVLATGHALEWWALAPQAVQPPREVVIRAAHWLVSEILDFSEAEIRSNYTYLSHAGRALALWRGQFPAEVYRNE
jgi:hypothetical protein